ncbi:MAG: hypothetical protein L0G25_03775 [Psychrobacter sp.]|nr:hypothetical protein [Psychrobacter sp.]
MLWRFYGLMLASQTWGAGDIGLLVAMFYIGVPLIWLQALLIAVKHSPFISCAATPATSQPIASSGDLRGAYR